MGYAILRIQKLKSGQAVRRSLKHAFREQDTPNADPSRTPENSHIGAANVQEALARFNARLPDKVRSNAVLAVEYLITGSPEDMHGKSRQEQDAYFGDALKWLEERHGKENVVYAGIHRDETTPHMYAYVVPIDERGKLNCRAFLGGAKALNLMQTEFAQKVGQAHGLQRGIEGSKARHQPIKNYYVQIQNPNQDIIINPASVAPKVLKKGLLTTEYETDEMTDTAKALNQGMKDCEEQLQPLCNNLVPILELAILDEDEFIELMSRAREMVKTIKAEREKVAEQESAVHESDNQDRQISPLA